MELDAIKLSIFETQRVDVWNLGLETYVLKTCVLKHYSEQICESHDDLSYVRADRGNNALISAAFGANLWKNTKSSARRRDTVSYTL